MAYTALYRVYRPQSFRDVVGQTHVTTTLRNALREGRLSHAYLFNGPRGTGKTSAAKIMAKAVNCEQPQDGEPCNQCATCRAISDGSVTDVLEIDAASNRGVEEIRDIRDKVRFAPSDVRYKVYIIDEVHMLTTEAFNALLKTLEEPPPHVIFILATTEPHKLPATIISRCQRFDFHRIALQEMVVHLKQICQEQQVEVEDQALHLVAKLAEGGMRDALSLLDQAISFSGNQVTLRDLVLITGTVSQTYFSLLAKQIAEQDIGGLLEQFHQVMVQGKDPEQFLQDLLYYYRDMLLFKTAPNLQEIVERTLIDEQFAGVASLYSLPVLYQVIEALNQALSQLKWSSQARVLVEMTLVKLCELGRSREQTPVAENTGQNVAELVKKIQILEERVNQLLQGRVTVAAATQVEETRAPQTQRRAPMGSGGSGRSSLNKVRETAQSANRALTQQLIGNWSQILAEVKKVKIQFQAWLINGQPVAASDRAVVVAFTSPIHCEKTMEPELRGIVERVIQATTGKELQFFSVMEEDWKEIEAQSSQPGEQSSEADADPFVSEALKLVGEQLLEIKE